MTVRLAAWQQRRRPFTPMASAAGEVWRQERVIGTVFEASVSIDDRHPASTAAHHRHGLCSAEATPIFDTDLLRWGIKNSG
jgi:hypothetical protein